MIYEAKNDQYPDGITRLNVLHGHRGEIYRIGWSPDGHCLASPCADGSIRIWDVQTTQIRHSLEGHEDRVYSAAWSPDGTHIISIARDKTIRLWDAQAGQELAIFRTDDKAAYSLAWSPDGRWVAWASNTRGILLLDTITWQVARALEGHTMPTYCLAWSPDSRRLASCGADKTVFVWDTENGKVLHALEGHNQTVIYVAWSPDGCRLASGGADKTIRVWNVENGQQTNIMEAHTGYITTVQYSADGRLMASKSGDSTVALWRADTCELITQFDEPRNPSGPYLAALSFHPKKPLLATLGEKDTAIRIWQLDIDGLIRQKPAVRTIHYTNAKVVLVGDTGVGKSGLGLVLTNKPFQETESTHNRRVHVFENRTIINDDGSEEIRETLLWDLAGQPGYRLIHQLHLNDVVVALVVFDTRNELDPFAGVAHWVRALRQAQRLRPVHALKIYLVAARVDRGHVGVSRKRIEQVMQELQIDGFFETSAKEGWGIKEVSEAIRQAINWEALPRSSSTELFAAIKEFFADARSNGLLLDNRDSLYYAFLRAGSIPAEEDLRVQFNTCLELLTARGVIERFSFGDLILLLPEILDSYTSAMVNAARDEPDGLGYIREEEALAGRFKMPASERLSSPGQEKLLLIATVEKLIRFEIALRVQVDDASYLVFPSQLTREHTDATAPGTEALRFRFQGPIINIYATLVVRLAQSGLFRVKDMWKNAVAYTATANGATCGIVLQEVSESQGELTILFDQHTSDYTRYQFEEYIYTHLRRRALSGTLQRHYLTLCADCGYSVPEDVVQMRKKRLFDWLDCPICGHRISLVHPKDDTTPNRPSWIAKMDQVANVQRDRAAALSTLSGKIATGNYDVFLCHNSKDKLLVKRVGMKLRENGILPWLDEWELRPGIPWQKILEEQIQNVRAAAIFVGENGVGPWQDMEQAAFLRQFVQRECPVIPVILPTCKQPPQLPYFLSGMTWVDFRKTSPDPLQRLIWGITGEKPETDHAPGAGV